MEHHFRRKAKIAKYRLVAYTKVTKHRDNGREGAVNVTQFVQKIHSIKLPPHQMRELGLSEGWQKKVPAQYIEKVVKTAERFKKDLRELSKR
ncbi:hypothetical protein [Desulfofundulus salinus]|uniref:hypothetical protein n=1 Tax=Desulfofundulus salinus TaxID=2419843 RepID=UPI000F64AC1D|nr:hypothetical protein [Desulfofundulus salinum]